MLGIICPSLSTLSAQTAKEKRMVRMEALRMYDKYINATRDLHNGRAYGGDGFVELFVTGTDSIYNDILPQNKPTYVDVQTYLDRYYANVGDADFEYEGFSLEEPLLKGNKWSIICHYSRLVTFVATDGIRYPAWDFQYTMRIIMNKSASGEELNPRIASITVSNPVKNLAVIINPNQIPLKWKGKPIHDYDPLCHCWITDLGNSSIDKLEYESNNQFCQVVIKQKNNKYTLTSHPVDIVGGGLYVAPYGFGNRTDGRLDFKEISSYSNAFYLQVHYGKNILTTQEFSLFVNGGLAVDNNNIAYFGDYSYSSNTNMDGVSYIDKDGDAYTRNIAATIDKEQWRIFGLTIPLTASYILNIDNGRQNNLFLSVEAGAFLSYRAIAMNSFNATAKYSGTYAQYWDVELENLEDYGYNTYTLNENNHPISYQEQIRHWDIGVSLDAGIWYKLNEQSFLKFDALFRKGFSPQTTYNKQYLVTEGVQEDMAHYMPVIYASNKGICNLYLGISFIRLLSK